MDALPVVRSGEWASAKPQSRLPCFRKLTNHLVEVLEDIPFQEDANQLFTDAHADLEFEIPIADCGWLETSGARFFQAFGPEEFEASWLLFPNSVELFVDDHVMFFSSAREFWAVPRNDTESILRLLELAEDTFEAAAVPIATYPLVFEDGSPVPWFPPADHPAYQDIHFAFAYSCDHAYRMQKNLYETTDWGQEDLKETGDFLIDHEIDPDTGFTFCRINPELGNQYSLQLPDVDKLHVGDHSVSLSDFLCVATDYIEVDPAYSPIRFRIRTWPDEATWDRVWQQSS